MSGTLQLVGGGSGVRAPRRWPQGLLRSPAGLGVVVWSVSLRRSLRGRLAPFPTSSTKITPAAPPVELVWPSCCISGFGALQAGTIKVGALQVRRRGSPPPGARSCGAPAPGARRRGASSPFVDRHTNSVLHGTAKAVRPSHHELFGRRVGREQWPSHRKSADRRRSPKNAGSACCSCTASVSSSVRLERNCGRSESQEVSHAGLSAILRFVCDDQTAGGALCRSTRTRSRI